MALSILEPMEESSSGSRLAAAWTQARLSYLRACTSCSRYRSKSSSGAWRRRVTAYCRTMRCVKLRDNNSSASSTSIGAHCATRSKACWFSSPNDQLTHFRNFVRACNPQLQSISGVESYDKILAPNGRRHSIFHVNSKLSIHFLEKPPYLILDIEHCMYMSLKINFVYRWLRFKFNYFTSPKFFQLLHDMSVSMCPLQSDQHKKKVRK